jgi:hypothetical protein
MVRNTIRNVPKEMPQGAEFLDLFSGLGSKHRNACVFDGNLPNILGLLKQWSMSVVYGAWRVLLISRVCCLGHSPQNFRF